MKKSLILLTLIIALLGPATHGEATIYKWVDQDGIVHFSDSPPASGQEVETIKTPEFREPDPRPVTTKPKNSLKPELKQYPKTKSAPARKRALNDSDTVEIYTTSWCKYCKEAIKFLKSNRIKYNKYDVGKDPKAAARMKALGGPGGVPFAIINGKKVIGFSKKRYKHELGLR